MTTDDPRTRDWDDPARVALFDEAPLWSVPFGLALLERVVLRPGLRVLDVGCGLGFPLLELAQRLGRSARLTGLDPWEAATACLERKRARYGLDHVDVVTGVAEAMPFEDDTFDLLTSNNALNNVEDRVRSLRECHRVARPGAQLVLTENLPDTMVEFYRAYEQVLRELGHADRVPAMHVQIRDKRKPVEETRALLEASEFEVVGEDRRSFPMRFLDGTTMLGHVLLREAFLPGFQSILDEGDRADVFRAVAARLDEQAQRDGSLTLTVPFVCLDCRRDG